MKRITSITLLLLVALCVQACAISFGSAPKNAATTVSDLNVKGEIEGENIVFTMTFEANISSRGHKLPLVVGDVAYIDGKFPRSAELLREGDRYLLQFGRTGKQSVTFTFASRAVKESEWRRTGFVIPAATVRKLAVVCDRDDLEIRFPGALKVERMQNKAKRSEVTAFLGLTNRFEVQWKPEVRRLDGELVVGAEANTIATASVGAMRLDTLFTYRIVQGRLTKLSFDLPSGVNVTQVGGDDIQEWRIADTDDDTRVLHVDLTRPREGVYKLRVECETILPAFPTTVNLSVITPRDVIRTSGFLMVGTDSVIKLLVKKSQGLTQVDQSAFPDDCLNPKVKDEHRPVPQRTAFVYQYANMPYTLQLDADDIVPEFTTRDSLVLSLRDNDLVLHGRMEVDVRAAETRELVLETDSDWIVANVAGREVTDYDVRDVGATRQIHIFFKKGILETTLIDVRLEKSLADDETSFVAPRFALRGAKTERGDIVLSAEKGFRLTASNVEGAREIRTGSTPMKVTGAQQAFRFKDAGWTLTVDIQRTTSAIHSEIFHLISIGEGVVYSSSLITYHISGAPTRTFRVRVPAGFRNFDFTGRDVRNFQKTADDNIWTVYLQEKVLGDYNLLVTFDGEMKPDEDVINVGGVSTEDTESEVGYIALASWGNLALEDVQLDPKSVLVIDEDEIPEGYEENVKAPVLRAYKYVRRPHAASVRVKRFATESMLNQIIDQSTLETHISPDGETITTVRYLIKNASQQYLVVQLPKDAKLWYAKVSDESMQMVSVRPPESEDGILVPLRRPRNPDEPIRVELQYAESHGEPGAFGETYRLHAPRTARTHSVATKWQVTAPRERFVAETGGNMLTDFVPAPQGMGMVLRRIAHTVAWLLSPRGVGLLGGVALVLAGLCGTAFFVNRRAGIWVGAPLSLLVVLGGFVMLAGCSFFSLLAMLGAGSAAGPEANVTFTKLVDLASGDGLQVSLRIVPDWLGISGASSTLLIAGLGGLAMMVVGARRGTQMGMALGITLLAVAIAQTAVGRAVLHGGVLLLAALAVVLLTWRAVCAASAAGRRSRARVEEHRARRREQEELRKAAAAALAARATSPAGAAAPEPQPEPAEVDEDLDDAPFADPDDTLDDSRGGAGRIGLLVALALVGMLTAIGVADGRKGPPVAPPPPPDPVMDSVALTIVGPGTGRDEERSAEVEAVFTFEMDAAGGITLLEPTAVLTDTDLGSRYLSLAAGRDGYRLNVSRKGVYTVRLRYLLPVTEKDGRWNLPLAMPASMRNTVDLTIPEKEIDIQCNEAVLFRTKATIAATTASAVFGPGRAATFTWQPRVRKTELEKAVYICEVNTFAAFEPGVVDLVNVVRYQIAQGEIKALQLGVPEGMSVTAVRAPGLSTWRYDPEARHLEAVLESPVSGDFVLLVMTQVATDGLPYEVKVGPLEIKGADRQRGAIAVASPDTVQARVGQMEGLTAMNIADFSSHAVALAHQQSGSKPQSGVKRAFRYYKQPVSAVVSADRVLPEIRVAEQSSLFLQSDRVVLASDLGITVSKAGIFSLRLKIPKTYDVETLSGEDVSHWDEVSDGDANVIVHFNKQVLGKRNLHVSITSTGKGVLERLAVPQVTVLDARKLDGHITVAGEAGIRMTPVDAEREGVSDLNPRVDLNRPEPGLLAFKLLRPVWRIVLKADVQAATVKPRVLQRVVLEEGMIQGRCHIVYDIANAGVKTFVLRAPVPGVPLTVTGTDVAKVTEIDEKEGLWQVDLHNKQAKTYKLDVAYQLPFDPNAELAEILPVQTVGIEPQSGYLVVMSGGRIQVLPDEAVSAGLKPEDSRSIPSVFGAGDLSDAIFCYRAISGEYVLPLSVVRHKTAEVLPARVEEVRLHSVLSDGGQLLTRVSLNATVGSLRFLTVTLPDQTDRLWTAFVNNRVARPSKAPDGVSFRIPLDDTDPDAVTRVELTYASTRGQGKWSLRRQGYNAPKLGLPLNNITWTLHVPPGMKYYDFDGDLEVEETSLVDVIQSELFNETRYMDRNARARSSQLAQAKTDMSEAEAARHKGQQRLARKKLEEAQVLAPQGSADYEDARIQLRNLEKQQTVMGLVNRRNTIKWNQNIQSGQQNWQIDGYNDGQFTAKYAQQVEQSLSPEDNVALQELAERFIDQQAAAAEVSEAIKVEMPVSGRTLTFTRPVQIDWNEDLAVSFKSRAPQAGRWWSQLWPAAIVFAFSSLALRRRRRTPAVA